ncbi:hypothetical protein MMC17_006917 [Xylographa soralifera]|nr:hypothetical protein [Xylographa soralifera]
MLILKRDRFRDLPVRLRVFMTDIYIVTGPDYINMIWKQSQHLRSEIYRRLIVYNMFGMPDDAAQFYLSDDSGINMTSSPQSNVEPSQRVKYLTHQSLTKLLTGSGLTLLAENFAVNLAEQFTAIEGVTSEWSDLPDLFTFMRDELFKATVRAICGENLLALNPTFCEDFWVFDKGLASLTKRFPRWVVPSAYAARDKCLAEVRIWHEFIQTNLEDESTNRIPNKISRIFGTEFIKSRQEMWRKMERMSPQAMASEDLGVIWGANGNSIPAAFWLVLEVFRNPSLLAKVRQEVERCLVTSQSVYPSFDLPRLCSRPLLQSIYTETLRLYVSTSIIRSPENADIKLGAWIIPKGTLIMIPSFVVHHNQALWSDAPNGSRSVETFCPDRFLRYPGPSQPITTRTIETPDPRKVDSSAALLFSSEDLSGYFMPYGGGHGMCPGRHFAKQEIIGALAIMVTLFDIELSENGAGRVQPDMGGFGMGALKPKQKVAARIRRRKI